MRTAITMLAINSMLYLQWVAQVEQGGVRGAIELALLSFAMLFAIVEDYKAITKNL